MSPALPARLRVLRELLAGVADGGGGAQAALHARAASERLDRDLLPRTAGEHTHLVVGIVGPNNAGKSALFNALVGGTLSPSLPTGGATRRLIGAAHPDLHARLAAEPTLAQFPIETVEPGARGVEAALAQDGDRATLLLVLEPALPARLLLVDTPDFDSVLVDNREASSALLRVADLAVVVVTRHTYQNREVVAFLESWLAHGRPWMLVYNESLGPEVTREHAAKLASDLASPPVAVFHAQFDLAVAEGTRPLAASALDGYPEGPSTGTPLADWLFAAAEGEELKQRALDASLLQLRDELLAVERALATEREVAEGIIDVARRRSITLGRDVAARAMPMGPFLDAFRAVLDRRPNILQKGYRGALKRTRLFVEKTVARIPFLKDRMSQAAGAAPDLVDIERDALRPAWPPYFEGLARELDPERNTQRSTDLDEAQDEALADALRGDLAPAALEPARERAALALADDPEVRRAFQAACEELIDEEFTERGGEWFFQFAVDLVHLLPAAVAGVLIVKTGGLGADVAVGGAGAVSSLLAEKVSRLLGTRPARRARRRWTELRGERLAEVVLEAALQRSLPLLVRRAREQDETARAIAGERKDIAWTE